MDWEFSKALILVVDDDQAGRYATARILRSGGHDVIEAETGEQAIECLRRHPDLVVLDVELPDMSGYEVTRRIKTDPGTRSILVLHLTAHYQSLTHKVDGLMAGADGYLSQPVEPAELLATVTALLRLRQSERQYAYEVRQWHATFNAMSDAVALAGVDGRLLRVNEAFRQLIGIDPAADEPVSVSDGILAELVPASLLAHVTGWSERVHHEVNVRGYWYWVSVDPVIDDDNQLAGHVISIRDVTERKLTEAALRNSEEATRLQAEILRNAPMPAAYHDPDLTVRVANIAYLNATGLREDQVIGRKCFAALGFDTPCQACPVLRAAETGEVCEAEFTPQHGDHWSRHGEHWVSRAAPVRSADGKIIGVIEVVMDITERARLHQMLAQAQKMESIGRLAGGVAHDFNNMLSVIQGYAELSMMRLEPTDPLYEGLTEIMATAQRSSSLTRQLLAFSRQQTPTPQVIDINRHIKEMMSMLKRLLGEDVRLAWEPCDDVWPVFLDPGHLDQILVNLCVNARDACKAGGEIRISTRRRSLEGAVPCRSGEVPAGEYVVLTVTDNGHGMSSDIIDRIFDPFFTTKGQGEGTGLGLATVYGVVKQYNGHIDVWSQPGVGSQFHIYLPRHNERSDAPAEPHSGTDAVSKGVTVLLVEDEPAIVRLTAAMLKRLGHRTLSATSPELALDLARTYDGAIDLLITDVIMPTMMGAELANQLRKTRPDVKVLYMSGYTADVIAQRGMLVDMRHLLHKPFTLQSLAAEIERTLSGDESSTL